jgi:acetyl esterase/lipase
MVHASPAPLPGVIGLVNLWGTPGGAMRLFQGVNPHAPATFTTHGTADALVPYENSTSFLAELQQAGIRCQLLTLPGAPHTPLMHFDQIAAAVAEFLKTL